MNDLNMAAFVEPKSTQLNADDLIGGPRTIIITSVRANGDNADQPVAIHFEGDEGKPYLACKSMRRCLIHIWGADAKNYVGRSLTLYCDPNVAFGGLKVGGIRISHASHIDKTITMALTETRAKRKPFTVQPLTAAPPVDLTALFTAYEQAATVAAWEAAEADRAKAWPKLPTAVKVTVKAASDAAKARIDGTGSAQS